MRKYLPYILLGASTFGVFSFALGATILFPTGGGTGIGSATAGDVGKVPTVTDDSPFTYALQTPTGGGGSDGNLQISTIGGQKYLTPTSTNYNFLLNSTNGLIANGSSTFGSVVNVGGAFNASSTGHFTGNLTTGGFLTAGAGTSTFTGGVYANDLRTNLPNCNTVDTDSTGALVCGTDADSGGGGAANVTYTSFSGTKYYTASSSATNNLAWHFNNGFVSSGASSTISDTLYLKGSVNASSTIHTSNSVALEKSTGAQLFFRDDENYAHWAIRNAGGNLYFATTTIGVNSTSSPAAFQLTGTGGTGLFVATTTNDNATGLAVVGTWHSSGITTLSGAGNVLCLNTNGEIVQDDSPITACSGASSRSIKHDIEYLDTSESLEKVLNFKPVSFKYNESYSKDQSTHLGFILEELGEVEPNLIEKNSVKYAESVALLAGAIQEQQKALERADGFSPLNYWGLIGLLGLIPLFKRK